MALLCFLFSGVKAQEKSNEWKVFKEADDVKIEYKYSDCHIDNAFHQEWVLLRVSNLSSKAVSVTYNMDLYYNDKCTTCNQDEYKYTFSLQPNEVKEGICAFETPPQFKVFVKFLDLKNRSVLTDFKLSNLIIE